MTTFPVNRLCPFAQQPATRVLGYARAGDIVAADPAYRPNALEILGIEADDRFPLVMGPSGFVYAGWLPDDEFLRREYEEASDYSCSPTETPYHRQFLLEFAAGFLDEANCRFGGRRLKLLDYGCGHGQLLRLLSGRDIEAFGYEPTAERLKWASGATLLTSLPEAEKAGPYDLLVCTEVLEHLPDPRAGLRFLRANASAGALLAVTVPNCAPSYVMAGLSRAASGGPFPAVLNPFEHLNQFCALTLRAMLAEEGFRVVRDFGRARAPALAAGRFGAAGRLADLKNVARVAKRVMVSAPSTQVFCEVV